MGYYKYILPVFLISLTLHSTMAAPSDTFSSSVSKFGSDVYQASIEGKDSNVIMSPLSIQTAISLAYMGAKGKTAEEMAGVMKFGSITRESLADSFRHLMETLNASPLVKIANKIYVKENYSVKKEFNEIATKSFYSEAQSLDFTKNVDSAKTINEWVENKTNNKIKDLIDPGLLDSDTRMVLVNAIYFKGFWTHQFNKALTRQQPFWTSTTDSVQVDMMSVKEHFKYGVFEDLDATAIELPYKDSDISMLVILPNQRDGLKNLEASLKTVDLTDLTKRMYNTEVQVFLPKFKIEFEINMNDVLKKMGMTTMFSDSADFSDLLDSPEPLKVSDVIHKAFIEVNEEGAEAAAATAVVIRLKRSLQMIKQFIIEHPFMLFLIKRESNCVLFTGALRKIDTIIEQSTATEHIEL